MLVGTSIARLTAEAPKSYFVLQISSAAVILRMTNGHPYGTQKCASFTDNLLKTSATDVEITPVAFSYSISPLYQRGTI